MCQIEFAMLPEVTPRGHRVIIYRLTDYDPNKIDFVVGVKAFLIINDILLSEAGLDRGTIAIFDLKGVTLSHLARINISAVRVLMKYIQYCHPIRLRGMHIINTVPFIDRFIKIAKPFLRHGVLNLVHFHQSVESLTKFFPIDILPEDYGGKSGKVTNNYNHFRHLLENTYTSWLRDEEKIRLTSLDKSLCKEANVNSFKKLEID